MRRWMRRHSLDEAPTDETAVRPTAEESNMPINSEQVDDDDGYPVTPGKILSLSSQERPVLLVALVLNILSEGVSMVEPLLLAVAYEAVVEGYDDAEEAGATQHTLTRVFILVLSLHVASSVFGFLAGCATGIAGERAVSRLRCRLYEHLLAQEMSFFDSQKTGDLVSRLSTDTLLVQEGIAGALNECLVGLIKVLAGLVLMFIVTWQLSFIVFGSLICWLCFVVSPLMYVTERLTDRYQNALAKAATASTEALGAMRTVRSFAAEAVEHDKYLQSIGTPANGGWWPARGETTYRAGVLRAIAFSALTVSGFLVVFGAVNVSLWCGLVMITENNLQFGKLTAFQAYQIEVRHSASPPMRGPPPTWPLLPPYVCTLSLLPLSTHTHPPSPSSPARTWPHAAQYLHTVSCCLVLTTSISPPRQLVIGIGQLAASAVELAQAKGGAAKIFKLLDKAPEIPVSGGEVPTETMRGAVSFKEVNFSYPSSPQQPVLRGLSFSVPGDARGARTPKRRTAPATHTPDPRCGPVGSRLHRRPRRPERMRQVDGARSAHAQPRTCACEMHMHRHTRPNAHAPHTRRTRAAHAPRTHCANARRSSLSSCASTRRVAAWSPSTATT